MQKDKDIMVFEDGIQEVERTYAEQTQHALNDFIDDPRPKNKKGSKKDKPAKGTDESFDSNKAIHIDFDIEVKSRQLSDEISLISVRTESQTQLYMRNEYNLLYYPYDAKELEKSIRVSLSNEGSFLKDMQVKEMVRVMETIGLQKEYQYKDIKTNIMVNNGFFTKNKTAEGEDLGLRFVPVEKDRLRYIQPCLKRIEIDYKEELSSTNNEQVENFMLDIMNGDKELADYLWHALATPFIERSKYEKAFVFYGETGRNGKSVLADLMKAVYGKKNVTSLEFQDMNGASLAILEHGFVNWVNDIEKYSVGNNLKKIVSGETIILNEKYKAPRESELTTQLFANTNVLPKLGAARDGGSVRRLVYIPFMRTFGPDNSNANIRTELITKENIDWIFAKLISIAKELNNDFAGSYFDENKPYAVVELENRQAEEDSSALGFMAWLHESLDVNGTVVTITGPELSTYVEFNSSVIGETYNDKPVLYRGPVYKVYDAWCKEEGIHALSKTNFEQQVKVLKWIELDKETRISRSRGIYKITEEVKND